MSSRKPYDTTFDLYAGPGFIVPNLFITGNIPCRVILQDQITPTSFPFSRRTAWITSQTNGWNPAITAMGASKYLVDFGWAGSLAIPAGGPMNWWIIFTESVVPIAEPSYARIWAAPLPRPA